MEVKQGVEGEQASEAAREELARPGGKPVEAATSGKELEGTDVKDAEEGKAEEENGGVVKAHGLRFKGLDIYI